MAGPGVFVPTPDADRFVDLALERIQTISQPIVVEVGTGCGAVALAVARARHDAEVHAIDLSPAAVCWTRHNRRELGLRNMGVHRGSLLAPLSTELTGKVGVILANIPYILAETYAPIGGVPRSTIVGAGDDGLDLHRRLARDAMPLLRPDDALCSTWVTNNGDASRSSWRSSAIDPRSRFGSAPS